MQQAAINSSDILHLFFLIVLIGRFIVYLKNREEQNKYVVNRKSKPNPPKKMTPEEMEQQAAHNREQIKINFENYYTKMLIDKEFVNKSTSSLDNFIINDDLNYFDLHKLAYLNGIKLQIGSGWYDLLMDLVKELDKLGWDRRVGCIKEKFGELRFYSDTEHQDLIDAYTEKSKEVCEVCGKAGELRIAVWWVTLCDEHAEEKIN